MTLNLRLGAHGGPLESTEKLTRGVLLRSYDAPVFEAVGPE